MPKIKIVGEPFIYSNDIISSRGKLFLDMPKTCPSRRIAADPEETHHGFPTKFSFPQWLARKFAPPNKMEKNS
jgi:hypothetical protein